MDPVHFQIRGFNLQNYMKTFKIPLPTWIVDRTRVMLTPKKCNQ